MARNPIVKVTVIGDAKQLARAFQQAERSAQTFGQKMDRWGSALTRSVTLPLVGLGTVAVKQASDLNEAIDKTTAIFGDAAGSILEWSKTAATSMGLARSEALDAAGGLGNMIQTTGIAAATAAEMSTNLVQLAADLGSLNNVDPTEMLVKMQAALAGEAEPLRKFGVLISAARVEAKAMELGLADANGEISDAAKMQARYAIILEDTIKAQGNFADTADGVANQTRIAKAQLEDMAATLGTNLLPVATQTLGQLNKMATAFGNLSAGTQQAIVQFAILAAAAGPLMKVISLLGTLGKVAVAAGASTSAAAAAAAVALGGLIVALREVNRLKREQQAIDEKRAAAASEGFPIYDPRIHWTGSLQTAPASGSSLNIGGTIPGLNIPQLSVTVPVAVQIDQETVGTAVATQTVVDSRSNIGIR